MTLETPVLLLLSGSGFLSFAWSCAEKSREWAEFFLGYQALDCKLVIIVLVGKQVKGVYPYPMFLLDLSIVSREQQHLTWTHNSERYKSTKAGTSHNVLCHQTVQPSVNIKTLQEQLCDQMRGYIEEASEVDKTSSDITMYAISYRDYKFFCKRVMY